MTKGSDPRSAATPVPGLEEGAFVTLSGKVGSRLTRRRKTGELFVKADLTTDDGNSIPCVWWEARRAPREGARVLVRGDVRRYGEAIEVHVRETRPIGEEAPKSFEHRLLRYFVACVEAEQMREVEFKPGDAGRRFVLLTEGPERIVTGDQPRVELPRDEPITRWCRTRAMAGPAEQSYAGFPLVIGDRRQDDREIRVLGPLFFVPISLRRAGEGYEVVLEASSPELNVYALDLLGVDREEREGLVSALEQLEELSETDAPLDRIRAWLDVLKTEALVPHDFEVVPDALEPLRDGPGLSNTAILYGGERGAIIHHLVQDLEELCALDADQLRKGPLGLLLGAEPAPAMLPAQPQPCVLPTNLSQDEAITNALERPLTVVTGPPGTGKSQVLVNAVAAAMARGESVLFASKNNQAVDVVFERVAQVADRAAPIRAGAARLRGDVARRMQTALARPPEPADFAGALEEWRGTARGLSPIYEQASLRASLEREFAERDAVYAEALRTAPSDTERIERPSDLLSALEEIQASLPRVRRRPRVLPWVKRRWQRTIERVDLLWKEIREGAAPAIELPAALDEAVIPRAREVLRIAAELAELRASRDTVAERLREIPERWELQERLAEAGAHRTNVARRLFRAAWARCLVQAPTSARVAGERFAEGLAQLGRGERTAVGRLLGLVPNVLKIFPVWGVTNLSARANFPLQAELFDLVVIDEASQCDLPSAIPLLYRAKRALIIGDPKQLTHVTSLRPAADLALARRWGLSEEEWDRFSYARTSLFALASERAGGMPIFLDQHFRSRLAIITFSNDHFYGSRLEVLTEEPERGGPAVEWIDVRGRFTRGPGGRSIVNPPEVSAVVEELQRLAADGELDDASIGVVTPYRAQAEAIRERIARSSPDLADRLTVASAHRFQGDERDVILFSPAVSQEMPGYHLAFAAQPNLVNVAITRARRRLIVIGDREACLASGTVLAELARYIDDLTSGGFRSPCERDLYDALVRAAIPARVAVEVGGRILDLAVEMNGRKVDIEVDGAAYHRDTRSDAIRDLELREAGWDVLRFSAREVRADPDACARRVIEFLDPSRSM